MIKLLKTVRHNKTLMKNSLMSSKIKQYLAHCEDNIINLSESSENSVQISDIEESNFDES